MAGRDSYGVEEVTIGDEDEIILLSAETATAKPSPHILSEGEYRSRGGLGRDLTRKTFATGFRIRDGAIVGVLVARP